MASKCKTILGFLFFYLCAISIAYADPSEIKVTIENRSSYSPIHMMPPYYSGVANCIKLSYDKRNVQIQSGHKLDISIAIEPAVAQKGCPNGVLKLWVGSCTFELNFDVSNYRSRLVFMNIENPVAGCSTSSAYAAVAERADGLGSQMKFIIVPYVRKQ